MAWFGIGGSGEGGVGSTLLCTWCMCYVLTHWMQVPNSGFHWIWARRTLTSRKSVDFRVVDVPLEKKKSPEKEYGLEPWCSASVDLGSLSSGAAPVVAGVVIGHAWDRGGA